MNAFSSPGDADDVMFEFFERYSQSDAFMDAIIKCIVCNSLFKGPLVRFIKQYVNSTVDECRLTQLNAKTGKVDKKDVPLSSSRLFSDAAEVSKNALKRESFRKRRSEKE